MKKLLFTAVSALAIAGVAVAADSTQFGVLKVPSTAAQTIVAVPWLETGTDNSDVSVANLVLTSGLSENDELRLYENGSWTKAWKLSGGKWVGAQVVTSQETINSGDDTTTIARGKALMLIRSKYSDGFYIMGKPASTTAEPITLPGGSSDKPAFSLIAPPTTTAFTITDETKWHGLVKNKDFLIVDVNGTSTAWTYTKKGWMSSDTEDEEAVIPAGQGVWFWSESTGSKTLSW